MAKPKKIISKETKVTPKVTEVKKEEIKKEEPKKIATSYLVPIALEREPMAKNVSVADLYYHVTSNSFSLHTSSPSHEAEVERVIEGDISIESSGNISMVSKAESPIKWMQCLNESREFSGNPFIAGVVQEIYEA